MALLIPGCMAGTAGPQRMILRSIHEVLAVSPRGFRGLGFRV